MGRDFVDIMSPRDDDGIVCKRRQYGRTCNAAGRIRGVRPHYGIVIRPASPPPRARRRSGTRPPRSPAWHSGAPSFEPCAGSGGLPLQIPPAVSDSECQGSAGSLRNQKLQSGDARRHVERLAPLHADTRALDDLCHEVVGDSPRTGPRTLRVSPQPALSSDGRTSSTSSQPSGP